MDKIRFGIIGTGIITERFLKAASLCEDFELTAVYSRSLKRAKDFGKKKGANLFFDDIDKLAASNEVDAVYIASPTSFHYKQTLIMLRSNKHVLCEKPAMTNSHELESLLQMAKEKQLILLEAIRNEFTPGYQVIKDNIEKIGKIRRASFIYCQYSSRYDKFKKGQIENAFRPEFSNGAIMDIGVYGVHMLVSLFGSPYSINAKGYMIPGSIDGSGVIIGKYKEMQAEIIYSKITNSYMPSDIQGEAGNIIFTTLASPEDITIILKNGEKQRCRMDTKNPDMYYEIRAFLDAIKGKTALLEEWNDNSLSTMKILDESRKQMDIVFPSDF